MAMARRRGRSKKTTWEQKLAFLLVGILILAAATALALAAPEQVAKLYGTLGISAKKPVPEVVALDANGQVNTAVGVHFIDVGQGDAVLLEADGEFALVDAGPQEGRDALLEYLASAGVTELKFMVMTHPHADHIGNMQAVLEKMPVGKILLPDLHKAPYPTSIVFVNLLDYMVGHEIAAETMEQGATYPLGSGTISVLQGSLATADNYNVLSPVLLYSAAGLTYLTTGDAEAINENAVMESGINICALLLKAGHHGSNTSNTAGFVQGVSPRLVVITCGAGNSYGHPHRTPLENFAAVNATVLRTDIGGNILVRPTYEGGLAVGAEKKSAG